MTRERLTLPEKNVRDYAHGLAFKLACERLAAIKDIGLQCSRSGARHLPPEKAVIVDYLTRPYRISLTDGTVTREDVDEAVGDRDKILVLDYFTQAKGTPLSGKLITYKELLDGINYYPTFIKRAISPIVNNFGNEPDRLLATAEIFGGRKADYGDTAVTIMAFSRVPLTIVLWHGDDEFPPDGSIMFDSTVSDYLTNDYIHALCENIAWTLVRQLKTGGDNSGRN